MLNEKEIKNEIERMIEDSITTNEKNKAIEAGHYTNGYVQALCHTIGKTPYFNPSIQNRGMSGGCDYCGDDDACERTVLPTEPILCDACYSQAIKTKKPLMW